MVAVSVDAVADNRRLVDSLGLEFPVLSDRSLAVISTYGLVHRGAGIRGSDIARPATFLVGPDGVVRWRHLPDNWRIRVRPGELISAIEEAGRGQALDPVITPARG